MLRLFKGFLIGTGLACSMMYGNAVAAPARPDVPGVIDSLTTCVGKFEAAQMYSTYVVGYDQAHGEANTGLKRILAALHIADTDTYVRAVEKASRAFGPELVADPLNTRAMLAETIAHCAITTSQAVALSTRVERREIEAADARRAEREARIAAQKAEQENALEIERAREQAKNDVIVKEAEARRVAEFTRRDQVAIERLEAEKATGKLQAERDALAKQNSVAEKKIAALESEVVGLEGEIKGLKGEIKGLQASKREPVSQPGSVSHRAPPQGGNPLVGRVFGVSCDAKATVSYFGPDFQAYLIGGEKLIASYQSYEMHGNDLHMIDASDGVIEVMSLTDGGYKRAYMQFDDIRVKASKTPLFKECANYPITAKFDDIKKGTGETSVLVQAAGWAVTEGDYAAVKAIKDRGFDFTAIHMGSLTYIHSAAKHPDVYALLTGETIEDTLDKVYDTFRDDGQPWSKVADIPFEMIGRFSSKCDLSFIEFRREAMYSKFMDEPIKMDSKWDKVFRSGNRTLFVNAGGAAIFEMPDGDTVRQIASILDNGWTMPNTTATGMSRCNFVN